MVDSRIRFLDSQGVALAHGRDRLALKGDSDRQVVITKRNADVSTKNQFRNIRLTQPLLNLDQQDVSTFLKDTYQKHEEHSRTIQKKKTSEIVLSML